jgi:hypothetical protein
MFYAVDLLAYYEYIHSFLHKTVDNVKSKFRSYLGPAPPDSVFILTSGDIIPSTVSHNHDQESSALVYKTALRQIHRNTVGDEERLQRLPYLTLIHKCGDLQHDFSEWVSQIRVVRQPSLLSLIRLAGLLHNVYLNEHSSAEVHVITRAGDEEVYVFRNTTELAIRPRPTEGSEEGAGTGLETEHHART